MFYGRLFLNFASFHGFFPLAKKVYGEDSGASSETEKFPYLFDSIECLQTLFSGKKSMKYENIK